MKLIKKYWWVALILFVVLRKKEDKQEEAVTDFGETIAENMLSLSDIDA